MAEGPFLGGRGYCRIRGAVLEGPWASCPQPHGCTAKGGPGEDLTAESELPWQAPPLTGLDSECPLLLSPPASL